MGIEKMRLLVHESVYWVNMIVENEITVKQCATCLQYQQTQPHKKKILYDILCKSWEVVGAYIFSVNNHMLLFM